MTDYKGHDWVITHYGIPVNGDIVARCRACGEQSDLDTYLAASYGYCQTVRYLKCTCGARACGYGNSGVGHAHHCQGRGTEAEEEEPLQLSFPLGYTPAHGP